MTEHPSWSPDGSEIAFRVVAWGQDIGLWVASLGQPLTGWPGRHP